MTRIFLIGSAPLPNQENSVRNAASLRTWQFVKPLLDEKNYQICLVTIDERQKDKRQITHEDKGSFVHYTLPKKRKFTLRALNRLLRNYEPDIVVGINNYPSYLASLLKTDVPMWTDLNGWLMSEGVEQAKRDKSDIFLPHLYEREISILKRADHISTVSAPQKYAICGELAALGYAHQDSDPAQFIDVVQNASEMFPIDKVNDGEKLIFGKIVPKEAFTVAFIGGYNTWVDEDTLFLALEKAIEKNPRVHFVSTGGALSSISQVPFQRFHDKIHQSSVRENFHFLGWVDTKDMAKIYHETSCGINVDKYCLETTTGARNRLNEMLKFGLPIITTLGSEIAVELDQFQAALTAKNGDHHTLAKHILHLAENKEEQDKLADRGKVYFETHCSYQATVTPFLKWLKNPKKRNKRKIDLQKKSKIQAAYWYMRKQGMKKLMGKALKG